MCADLCDIAVLGTVHVYADLCDFGVLGICVCRPV